MPKAQPWQELQRETDYKMFSLTVERRIYRLPSGEIADYYIRIERAGVCAFALTRDHKVITMPQFRPGPGKILRELPGGLMEAGENAHTAAMRELLEETGYAGEIDPSWTGTWQSDAYTQSNRNVVIIKNCKKVAEPQLDATEFGEVELVPLSDFLAQLRAGELTDTAGAFLALERLRLLA